MAIKVSAGILLYRQRDGLEVLLVHPGGPFWAKKDLGAWSIPKGEVDEGEDARVTALREFEEEVGCAVTGELQSLDPVRQAGGKTVHAWAARGELDPALVRSNTFSIEWPPRSGKQQTFPEIDRAEWFPIEQARRKILAGQSPLLDQLQSLVSSQRS